MDIQNTIINYDQPLVSVTVQTYQHAPYIKKCLDSILVQKTNFPFEIILGEDESSDGTREICQKYADAYPDKIRLFLRSRKDVIKINGYPTGRYNFIQNIKSARGKYIANCPGDDYWLDPYKLQKQFDILEKNDSIVACHHWHMYQHNDKDYLEAASKQGYFPQKIASAKEIFSDKLRIKSRTIMYRNIIDDTFFPDWFYNVAYGDVPFSFLLGMYGNFYFIDEPMAVYRVTHDGLSNAGKQEKNHDEWMIYHYKQWISIWKHANRHYNFLYQKEAYQTIKKFYKIIEKHHTIKKKMPSIMNSKQFLGDNLIFLISPPRSGSTMLQRVLSGHSQIYTTAEPWLMLHPVYAMRNGGIQSEYDTNLAHRGLKDFLENINSEKPLLNAIRAYAYELYGAALNGQKENIFLDKTPRYYLIINELLTLFPQARFIFLQRNPLAILASIFSTWTKKNYQKLLNQKFDITTSINNILHAKRNTQNKDKTYFVQYEQLVAHPKKHMLRLLDSLQLSFEDKMLDYANLPSLQGSMGDPVNAKKLSCITPEFNNKWQKILQSDPVYWFMGNAYLEFLGPEKITEWGYSYNSLNKMLNSKQQTLNSDERKLCHYLTKEIFWL
jgi:glycosyltransferase involved in cell wall biosynthesis